MTGAPDGCVTPLLGRRQVVVVVPENDEGEVPSRTYRSLPGESAVVGAEELQTVDDRMRQSALQRSSVTVPHVLHCK